MVKYPHFYKKFFYTFEMSSLKQIEKDHDLEILNLLELEEKEYEKLKKIRLKIEKKF